MITRSLGRNLLTGVATMVATLCVTTFSYAMSSAPSAEVAAAADPITEFQNSWAGQALATQRAMTQSAPFSEETILGSHNTYNSEAYRNATRYIDPQQIHSIYDQLRIGARFIELDVHWTAHTHGWPWEWGTDLLLCHSGIGAELGDLHLGCSLTDRFAKNGVQEVANWLNANPNEVIILYFEDHSDGHHQELYNIVNGKLGNKIYRSEGCRSIPSNLSRKDVLNAGKQVVLWKDGGCSNHSGMQQLAFTGLGQVNRIWEDRTSIGAIGAFFTNGSVNRIETQDVIQAFNNGGNIVNLDNLTYNDGRMAAGVWSWDQNEPNNWGGNQDCALQWGNGRWDDAHCDSQHFFACQNNETGEWEVSTYADGWTDGQNACGLLGNFRFAAPQNAQQNQALFNAKGGITHVWVNASDAESEGQWIIH